MGWSTKHPPLPEGKRLEKKRPKKSGRKAPKRIPINQTGFHEMSLVGFWSLLILDKNGIHSHLFKNHCLFSEGLAQSTSLEILILAESTLTCGFLGKLAGWPPWRWTREDVVLENRGNKNLAPYDGFINGGERTTYYRETVISPLLGWPLRWLYMRLEPLIIGVISPLREGWWHMK